MANHSEDNKEILEYYNNGAENGRLNRGIGKIEFERTKEIISRYLTEEKKVIYDIGGGIGTYSRWLAGLGHEVHMFELAPEAVKNAKDLQEDGDQPKIQSIEVSDARSIDREAESADIVLLMGPLYHLTEKGERLKAIREASRVLKKDGIMVISAISRFGSMLWGLSVYGKYDFIDENEFKQMIETEIASGQHIRPEKYPYFIARAYFHLPNELKSEIEECGLIHDTILAVEGPSWIVPTLDTKWEEDVGKERLLQISKLVEAEESLLGMSPHMLAIARKK